MSSDTSRVLAAVARLIQNAREKVPWYAGPQAPLRTDQISDLLGAFKCVLVVHPLDERDAGMALPRLLGLCPIIVPPDTARTERMFSIRHELGHVIAGELDEPTYLTSDDAKSFSERMCDLFAFADLIPGWLFRDFRRMELTPDEANAELHRAILEMVPDWPEERAADRAGLRMRFYREYGI